MATHNAKKYRNKGLSSKEATRLRLKKEGKKSGLNYDTDVVSLTTENEENSNVEDFKDFNNTINNNEPLPFSAIPQKNKLSLSKKIVRALNHEKKDLKRLEKTATKIIELEPKYQKMSDEQLKEQTKKFKDKLAKENSSISLDDILVDAFAVAREAAYRVLGLKAFKVQLMGAIALHNGDIAEMKTGEGKTLTSIFPIYLNALSGNGVHVITVNEYLGTRDATENGKVFEFLGLKTGLNLQRLSPLEKKRVFNCDITYSTHSELGFDYLRDNMVFEAKDRVLRNLNYALIDEVDSVLIDEARTPLIISGGKTVKSITYRQADKFAKSLRKDKDYEVDIESKTVSLTVEGIEKAEKTFKIGNLYDIKNISLLHRINQALKANYTMENNVDYIVATEDGTKNIRNAKIMIVDKFTGRVMKGREFNDGLHQALEAKEGVPINNETEIRASITYQNFFRLYNKLCGMTGTAKTEEDEFLQIYNMRVVEIPTNKPILREDKKDIIYGSKQAKYNAILNEVKRRHAYGQPILIGTTSIEVSELLSKKLSNAGIKHNVLNAKNHLKEANIIANAGQLGAVTIATNMAGRGTDIKLGKSVAEIGGLCVIGSERHESRRIDNQLRGRSGRQGDAGCSIFFVSTEDELFERFSVDKIKELSKKYLTEGKAIQLKSVAKAIEQAQKRIENQNFESRKDVLKYDDVMREHREIFYKERQKIVDSLNVSDYVLKFFEKTAQLEYKEMFNCDDFGKNKKVKNTDQNNENITKYLKTFVKKYIINADINITPDNMPTSCKELSVIASNLGYKEFLSRYNPQISEAQKTRYEKSVILSVFDNMWVNHIITMDKLKDGMYLRGYAQKDPVQEYTEESYNAFNLMTDETAKEICKAIITMGLKLSNKEGINSFLPRTTLTLSYKKQ